MNWQLSNPSSTSRTHQKPLLKGSVITFTVEWTVHWLHTFVLLGLVVMAFIKATPQTIDVWTSLLSGILHQNKEVPSHLSLRTCLPFATHMIVLDYLTGQCIIDMDNKGHYASVNTSSCMVSERSCDEYGCRGLLQTITESIQWTGYSNANHDVPL